jgi:hypothetical protein
MYFENPLNTSVKGKVVPVLKLSKHYVMNVYGGVDV